MSAEPISTRIARLRGCKPVSDGDGGWMCHCALNTHGAWCDQCSDRHEYINEAWLTPAASFALLAEMVEGTEESLGVVVTSYKEDGEYQVCGDPMPDDDQAAGRASTLGEAIALAYEAYATAKAARQ